MRALSIIPLGGDKVSENKRSNLKENIGDSKVLVTGGAGFIGYFLTKRLLEEGYSVIGYDNMNTYYDVKLKEDRLEQLEKYPGYIFVKGDLSNQNMLQEVFKNYSISIVVNLGAQAGVRYSIENPDAYIQSNVVGFYHILECCRNFPVKHLVFASSSSVYGANKKVPFSVEDNVDKPVSLYAATKKSNELFAYSYCKLYKIPATGLRFFTVYGPFGRPDMAYFSFTEKILRGEPIKVFNHGDMYRDFTYIDDIIEGVYRVMFAPPNLDENNVRYKIYNIGNNKPEKIMDFIETIEDCVGKKAEKVFYPMQPGDVYQTYADIKELENDFGFRPKTTIEEGIGKFTNWYREHYNV